MWCIVEIIWEFFKKLSWVSKMVQLAEGLATKPGGWNLIPGTPVVERESRVLEAVL